MQHATHATAYICNMRHMQQHKYATRYTHRIHMQYATRNSMYMRHTQQHTAARWRSRRHTAQNATTPWHRRATANPPPDLTVPRGITAPHGMPCPVKFPGGKSYTPSRPQMLCLPVRTSCGCHCVPYGGAAYAPAAACLRRHALCSTKAPERRAPSTAQMAAQMWRVACRRWFLCLLKPCFAENAPEPPAPSTAGT